MMMIKKILPENNPVS